ncbi:MAG: hypothetical protein K2M10_03615 [Muribaculaceae bacterium]|nr:hypothetical protein [Muribaculaceae bacterium]
MIFSAYLRWRHSKGFGVHSPFAYDVVTTAVRPGKYGFYGYEAIDEAFFLSGKGIIGRMRHDARLLLRMVYVLGIKRVFMAADTPLPFVAAVKSVGAIPVAVKSPRVPLPEPAEGDMIFGDPLCFNSEALGKWVAAGGTAMIVRGMPMPGMRPIQSLTDIFSKVMTDGLLLYSPRIVVAHPRKEMEFTSYSMKF